MGDLQQYSDMSSMELKTWKSSDRVEEIAIATSVMEDSTYFWQVIPIKASAIWQESQTLSDLTHWWSNTVTQNNFPVAYGVKTGKLEN